MKGLKQNLKERIAYLRILSGEPEAFGFFYDQYAEKIYKYIVFKVSNRELAEDLTHEVFLLTWQHIIEDKSIGNLRAYLYRIAHNKVVDHYRQKSRQTQLLTDDHPASEKTATYDQGEIQILKRHIQALKPEYQEVVVLRHIDGLSIEEICTILQKDKNNIRVTLHRAMNKLKESYQGSLPEENDTQN